MHRLLLVGVAASAVLAVAFVGGRATTASAAAAADPLTRIYRGDDGSLLYLRQIGTQVYGFAEQANAAYAYVLKATVSGDKIDGDWWDVPKGIRRNKGHLHLKWSFLGARVERTSDSDDIGAHVFTAVNPVGVKWAGLRGAGFQATAATDVTGAFAGDDGSRHYATQTAYNTVWVAEKAAQPDERPGWVTVFFGKRKTGGGYSGTYVDVPKGLESATGSFGAAVVSGTRDLMLSQTGAARTKRLSPDYALDWDAFASKIDTALSGKVVGYAYAIAHNGAVVRSNAGGSRRLAVDGGVLPFTTGTYTGTASAAKTITATAIVKALHARGLTVDAKVAPFLPSCIKQGPGMSTLTFRELLNHSSGLQGGKGEAKKQGRSSSCDGSDPFDCLLKILKEGRTHPRTYDYNNKAYDLFRFLVPLVDDPAGVKGEFALHNCKNTAGVLNRKLAEKFATYIFDEVLDPAGAHASFKPSGDYSLNYDFANQKLKGFAPQDEYFIRSGSGKLTMPVVDYVRFLSALDRGEIIPKSLVTTMKGTSGNRLGFDSVFPGRTGSYVWKNGGCPDWEGKGRKCSTVGMIFPGDTQVYIAVNSSNNTYKGATDQNGKYHAGLDGVAGDAFDKALG